MEIFVINLDRRQDRWREISDHLTGLGLRFSRVAAIDGLTLEENDRSLVPRGIDACWRSHQLVFALITQNRAMNALVLEDDAVLDSSVDWAALLNDLDEFVTRASIDVLQLGFVEDCSVTRAGAAVRAALIWAYRVVFRKDRTTRHDRWECIAGAPRNLELVPDSSGDGSHCYVLSRRAARAFLGLNTPTFTSPDTFFSFIANEQRFYQRFKIARTRKNFAVQRSRVKREVIDSDLEPYYAIEESDQSRR